VDAAAAYTSAQERVTQYMSDVDVAKEELAGAQTRLTEAISDRDMKKQVLQALVGGAS
jgi:hypothetical protein